MSVVEAVERVVGLSLGSRVNPEDSEFRDEISPWKGRMRLVSCVQGGSLFLSLVAIVHLLGNRPV